MFLAMFTMSSMDSPPEQVTRPTLPGRYSLRDTRSSNVPPMLPNLLQRKHPGLMMFACMRWDGYLRGKKSEVCGVTY